MGQDVVKNYYEAFNQGQFSKMLSYLSEDVVHEVNEGDAQVGLEQFRQFMAVMDEHYSEQVKELVVFSSNDPSRWAAEFYIDGVYKKTQPGLPEAKNQKYYIKVGAFFELKNGKISRVTNHYNLVNWIKAVS